MASPPQKPRASRDVAARWADTIWSLARRIHLGTRRPDNWVKLVKFGAVGASGYVVNLAVFAVLTQALDIAYIAAAILAFCIAVMNNFVWNRLWTFSDSAGDRHAGFQAARFFAVSVLALGINLAALALLVDGVGLSEIPSQAIAVAVAMPFNFVGNKMWTFGWDLGDEAGAA